MYFPAPKQLLDGLLREWLPRQRWFAGKDRPITDLRMLSMTELYPGCLHLLVHAGQSGVPTPGGTPPAGDCYQLLLGIQEHLSPRLGRALIGRVEEGPLARLGRPVSRNRHKRAHNMSNRLQKRDNPQ